MQCDRLMLMVGLSFLTLSRLLTRVARLMIHTPTAISIFVCLSMVQLMAVFISMRCTLCGHFLQVALTLIVVIVFFNDTATTEIYTLSLHDALPISPSPSSCDNPSVQYLRPGSDRRRRDRKSTRLNSSHITISYAVFCLKKKTQ